MKETRAYAELVCDTLAASFDFPATVQSERFCIALCQPPLCARFPVYPTINPFLSSSMLDSLLTSCYHFPFPRSSLPHNLLLFVFVAWRSVAFYALSTSLLSSFQTFVPGKFILLRVYKSLWSFNHVNLIFLSPIFLFVRNFDGTSSFSELKEPRFTFSTLYDSSLLSFRFFHRRPFSLSAKYLPLETQTDQKLPLSLFTLTFHPSFRLIYALSFYSRNFYRSYL